MAPRKARLASSDETHPQGPDSTFGALAAHAPWRIRSSLALLIVACMLPGMVLAGYFIFSAYAQQKAYALRDALSTARAVAINLDRDLASVESGLRVLATSGVFATNDLQGFDSQAREALPYQRIANYVLIDASGRQRVNTLRPWGSPLPVAGGPPELRHVFEQDRTVLTDIFIGPVTGKPILAMAVPVRRDGHTVYSLGAGLLPERISGVLASQNLPSAWIAAVLDGQGRIVARSHGMDLYVGKPAVPALIKASQENQEGIIETVTLEGIPVISAYSHSRLFDWKVAVGVPRAVLTADLKRSMLLLLGASLVVFALAMSVAWQLVMRRIAVPADQLLDRMRRMSRGEDPGPSVLGRTSREFAALDEGFADMSAQLRLREQEREAKLAAEAANRAKTEFLSRMSHELRTPLNAVLGFAQVLKLDPSEPLSPRQGDMVDQIARSGQHLLDMISDVLDVSRIEAGTLPMMMTDVDLREVVDECRQMIFGQAMGTALRMTFDLPEGRAHARADRTRLKQVLLNLLSNAIKYNQRGGEVHLGVTPHNGDWRITVRDTGIGMTPEQMSHLFEPFNRLGREHEGTPGTGIGLVICRRLLEMMDTTLSCDSTPDKGSRFWFDLPRVEGPAVAVPGHPPLPDAPSPWSMQPAAAWPPVAPATDTTPRNILYVEDNSSNRDIMRTMLAMRPHLKMRFEGSVLGARQALLGGHVDLVLLDKHLPDGGGLDLLAWMRQQPAHRLTPVIMVSADVQRESIAEARQAGATAYLHKPLDLKHTLEMVDMVLAQRRR